MNTASPKNQPCNFTLDNTGSAAVLAAAVLLVASGAFSAFVDPAESSTRVARQDEARAVVAATQTSPAPQKILATPTVAKPMIIAANQ